MQINKDLPLGAVHIKLPFNSMDDVSFSGAYGGVADALVEKLREHLQQTGGEPNPEDNTEEQPEDNTKDQNDPELPGPSNLLKRVKYQ